MTSAELRSRIAWSGISGKRLAELLGIPQPNVSGWCTGIRSIPAHHVARIIELTDNPPSRTEPPWRPPADMPPSRRGRTIRAKRRPFRKPAPFPERPLGAVVNRGIGRPASRRESAEPAQTLDLSGWSDLLNYLASPRTDGNEPSNEETVPAGPLPVTSISLYQQPPAAPPPAPQMPRQPTAPASMTGPLHADFVAQENARVRPIGPDAIMLMQFFKGQH